MLLQQWWKEWKQMAHHKEGKWLLRHWWDKGKIGQFVYLYAYKLIAYEVSTFAIEQILQSSNLWTIIQRKKKRKTHYPSVMMSNGPIPREKCDDISPLKLNYAWARASQGRERTFMTKGITR
jgi:hypothetical protein